MMPSPSKIIVSLACVLVAVVVPLSVGADVCKVCNDNLVVSAPQAIIPADTLRNITADITCADFESVAATYTNPFVCASIDASDIPEICNCVNDTAVTTDTPPEGENTTSVDPVVPESGGNTTEIASNETAVPESGGNTTEIASNKTASNETASNETATVKKEEEEEEKTDYSGLSRGLWIGTGVLLALVLVLMVIQYNRDVAEANREREVSARAGATKPLKDIGSHGSEENA